ncbi:hypothetical protein B566_EDAN015806 [Ephemera danica]|nr:hypothetical protein B566_EDAN015806 [Ephemera danica]
MSHNNSSLSLLCPTCGDCPCEIALCTTENCQQLYQLCTTIFSGCDNVTQIDVTRRIRNQVKCCFRHTTRKPHDVRCCSVETTGEADLDWYFLAFALTLMAAGAVGNILVCLAVCTDRALQNSTNYFLLSLAVADLLVSLCVMPLGAIPSFLGYWPLGLAWCSVYVTSDVLACSSSILHMCVISLGRYMGIRSPLRARHRTSKRHLAKKVAYVWLLASLISSSITVLGAHDAENIMPSPDSCNINNRAFRVFGSIASFYAPMLLMVGSYALTLHLLRRKARFSAKARAQRLLQQGRTMPVQMNPAPTASTRQANGGAPRAPVTSVQRGTSSNGSSRGDSVPRSLRLRAPSQLRLSEHKASTVLGLVFASFVLCWAPFFVLNVLAAVFPSHIDPAPSLVSVCLWLGYGSSCINPIIYTVFNRSFRSALLRVLRCRGAPPPVRFRSVTECRTIAGNSSMTTPSSASRTSSHFPTTFDILP